MDYYFREKSNTPETIEVYLEIKKQTETLLQAIIENDQRKFEESEKIEEEMILRKETKIYAGHQSYEIKIKKQFQELSNILTQSAGRDAEKLTVFQYFSTEETLLKQIKKQNGESNQI